MNSCKVSNIDSSSRPCDMNPHNDIIMDDIGEGDGGKRYNTNHSAYDNNGHPKKLEDGENNKSEASGIGPNAPTPTSEVRIHKPPRVNGKFKRSSQPQQDLNTDFKMVPSPRTTPGYKESPSSMSDSRDQAVNVAYLPTPSSEDLKGQYTPNPTGSIQKQKNPNSPQVDSRNSSLRNGANVVALAAPKELSNGQGPAVLRSSPVPPTHPSQSPAGALPDPSRRDGPLEGTTSGGLLIASAQDNTPQEGRAGRKEVVQDTAEGVALSTLVQQAPSGTGGELDEVSSEYYEYEKYEGVYEESSEYYYYEEIYEEEVEEEDEGGERSEEEPRINVIYRRSDEPAVPNPVLREAVVGKNTMRNEQGAVTHKSSVGPSYRGTPASGNLKHSIFEKESSSREDTPERMNSEVLRRSFKIERQTTKDLEGKPIKDSKCYLRSEPYAEGPQHIDPNEANSTITTSSPFSNMDVNQPQALAKSSIHTEKKKEGSQDPVDIYIGENVFLNDSGTSKSMTPAKAPGKHEETNKSNFSGNVDSKETEDIALNKSLHGTQKGPSEAKQNEPIGDGRAPALCCDKDSHTEQTKDVLNESVNFEKARLVNSERKHTSSSDNSERGVHKDEKVVPECGPDTTQTAMWNSKSKIDKATITETLTSIPVEAVSKGKKKPFFANLFNGCTRQKKGDIASDNRANHLKKSTSDIEKHSTGKKMNVATVEEASVDLKDKTKRRHRRRRKKEVESSALDDNESKQKSLNTAS